MQAQNINNATNDTTSTNGSGKAYNPKSILGKDDFLKLFLTELQYQDPTSPMDTQKIITQTADLTTVESMQNLQKSMGGLIDAFRATSGMDTISAVGKVADTGMDGFTIDKGGYPVNFKLYFPQDYKSAEITVKDSTGNVIKKFPLEGSSSGVKDLVWDGYKSNGDAAEAGAYTIEAKYITNDGVSKQTKMGIYPIESIVLGKEIPEAKIGDKYYKFNEIKEIIDPAVL